MFLFTLTQRSKFLCSQGCTFIVNLMKMWIITTQFSFCLFFKSDQGDQVGRCRWLDWSGRFPARDKTVGWRGRKSLICYDCVVDYRSCDEQLIYWFIFVLSLWPENWWKKFHNFQKFLNFSPIFFRNLFFFHVNWVILFFSLRRTFQNLLKKEKFTLIFLLITFLHSKLSKLVFLKS